MNNLERVLAADLRDLLGRLQDSIPEGTVEDIRRTMPKLRKRLDQIDVHLADEYALLTAAHASWKGALEDLENVWALAAWRSTVDPAAEDVSRIAA